MSKRKFYLVMSSVVLLGVLLDQVSKACMGDVLSGGHVIDVIGTWLQFMWMKNYGAAFGMGEGQSVLFFIFFIVGLPLMGYLLVSSRKNSLFMSYGLAMAMGGAIGNAIDRFYYATGFYDGYVRDFISVRGFAVFNVADMLLNVGVACVILSLLFFDKDALLRRKKPETEKKEQN